MKMKHHTSLMTRLKIEI